MTAHAQRLFRKRGRDDGFTLIEVLVSLTLLALLMAMVPSTLHLSKRAWEKAASTNESIEAATLAFAAQHIENAIPLFKRDPAGLQDLAFTGNTNALSYVTELDHGPQGGGLYAISIAPAQADASNSTGFAVQIQPFQVDQGTSQARAELRSLSPRYRDISFRYFGIHTPGRDASWDVAWARKDRLPDLVEVRAMGASDQQPKLEIQKFELKLRRN